MEKVKRIRFKFTEPAIPRGWRPVNDGLIHAGDKVWSDAIGKWETVKHLVGCRVCDGDHIIRRKILPIPKGWQRIKVGRLRKTDLLWDVGAGQWSQHICLLGCNVNSILNPVIRLIPKAKK